MGDRTSVAIEIGGTLQRSALAELVTAANEDGLSLDWSGAELTEDNIIAGIAEGTLFLTVSESYTDIRHLVSLCAKHGLVWRKSWDAYPGSYYAGGELRDDQGYTEFDATGTDCTPLMCADEIRKLGSWGAVIARLDRLTRPLPPLVVLP